MYASTGAYSIAGQACMHEAVVRPYCHVSALHLQVWALDSNAWLQVPGDKAGVAQLHAHAQRRPRAL